MSLSNFKVVAGLAVSDMEEAGEFCERKLGLTEWTGPEDNRAYECADGSVLHVYLSPDHAGGTTATLASWYVRDIENLVDELTSRGVVFERYDDPPTVTDERGIATFGGGAKVEYEETPDGIAAIGPGESGTKLQQHYFDTRGVSRVYEMSLSGGVWKLWRDSPGFSQRFTGTFSDDGQTIRGTWEKSTDGSTWEHDFDIVYTKVEEAARA
jgi:hypothetical protein